MPLPSSITQEDKDLIAQKTEETSVIAEQALADAADTAQEIVDLEEEEAVNKKMWDFYHGIIESYEDEITQLNGVYISSPVVEQDLLDRVDFTGRLWDATLVDYEMIRITQFDGSPTGTNSDYEKKRLSDTTFSGPLSRLQNGLTTSNAITVTTTEAITGGGVGASKTFGVNDISGISNGMELIVHGNSLSFIAIVTSTGTGGYCSDPMYTDEPSCTGAGESWTVTYGITVTLITPFSGTISLGATGEFSWSGFTNTERTNKTSTNYQTVMDYYITQLYNASVAQAGFLSSEQAILGNNEDPNLAPSALSNVNTALSFYQAWSVSKDISDYGISSLNYMNSTRLSQVNARISASTSAKSSYYDDRFAWSDNRAGLTGTLVQIESLQKFKDSGEDFAQKMEDKVALYEEDF